MLKYFLPIVLFRIYGLILVPVVPVTLGQWVSFSRGFFSDVFLGLCLWFVLERIVKSQSIRLGFFVFFLIVSGINLEHIHANFSNMDFDFLNYAVSETFLLGSVLSVKNLPTLIFCVFNSILFLYLRDHNKLFRPDGKIILLVGLIFVWGSLNLPLRVGFSYWAQMHFLEENLRGFFVRVSTENESQVSALKSWDVQNGVLLKTSGSPKLMETFFRGDLSGREIMEISQIPQNILIVMVEGLSYDLIEQGKLPFLGGLKKEGIFYNNFIALQRQTNRGVYASLCGDYPNFLNSGAKMDMTLSLDFRYDCLPELLKKKGYSSVFMQSSNLHFMHKGRFARSIGFDEVYGDDAFENPIARSNWGVDDLTLYRYALDKIEGLSQTKSPWMLTLLTVGTHHPYLVPGISTPSPEQALMYADDSLREFVEELKRREVLKNTLLVITSDESAFGSGTSELEIALSQHHAPLIIMGGSVPKPQIQNNYFTQADLLISFADFLGIDPEGSFGRSVFRRYAEKRSLFFGNVYSSKLYSFSATGEFYICSQDLDCEVFLSEGDFFGETPIRRVPEDPHYVGLLKEAFLYNDSTNAKIEAGKSLLEASLR